MPMIQNTLCKLGLRHYKTVPAKNSSTFWMNFAVGIELLSDVLVSTAMMLTLVDAD